MILCRDRKFVFIGVPRTACRTLQDWFLEELEPPAEKVFGYLHRVRLPRRKWCEIGAGWAILAVIRHPLDRLASMFYRTRLTTDWIPARRHEGKSFYRRNLDFSGFVRLVLREERELFYHHWDVRPISVWLAGCQQSITHPLRFERLREDVETLPFIHQPVVLKNKYASERAPLKYLYQDPEILALALAWGQPDFEAYGYESSLQGAMALRGEEE